MSLRVRRLKPAARLPARAEPGSVGYDLCACLGTDGPIYLHPLGRIAVPTGIAVAVPPRTYGRVAPRSGLAVKHGLDVLAGVIDPSYRGEVLVVLHNTGDRLHTINHGDRIAQLLLERAETPEVEEVAALDDTARGAGGFGSTDI